MPLITNILFPVDFSPSCVAMAPYVKRAAALFGARVSLIHVFDPASYNGFEQYLRRAQEIAEEHRDLAGEKFNQFLSDEFPIDEYPRILTSGDASTEISSAARNGFDLIIMPTHAGFFRRMLLGSTTAKVLNDAECPVLTSRHAETIAPRPLEHKEWLCAIGLGADSERVLRYASQAAEEAKAQLTILHAIQADASGSTLTLDLKGELQSVERKAAFEKISEVLQRVGAQASVRISVGSVKEALLEAARQSDADVLMIGRSSHPHAHGRLRDLTYAMVRDSPFPVLSI